MLLLLWVLKTGFRVLQTGFACRGLGRQASLMWFNIIGFWAVGFSTGYTLAFKEGWGLPGVWYGIFSGVMTTGLSSR